MSMNVGHWRIHPDQPHIIGGVVNTGQTGGYVDLATITDARRVSLRTHIQRAEKRREIARKEAKRKSRHRNREVE